MDLISDQKIHPRSEWSFDSQKNVLFKEKRHYPFFPSTDEEVHIGSQLLFLILGLIIACPIYLMFSETSIYGYLIPIEWVLLIFIAVWVNFIHTLNIHYDIYIPFLTNKINRKEINLVQGKYVELQVGTDKKSKTIKNEKFSKFNLFIRENTNQEDPKYVRRGDVDMVERSTDGYWLGPYYQKIVISYTVILQLVSRSRNLDIATVDTMLEARDVISSFDEIISKMSSKEDWWKDEE